MDLLAELGEAALIYAEKARKEDIEFIYDEPEMLPVVESEPVTEPEPIAEPERVAVAAPKRTGLKVIVALLVLAVVAAAAFVVVSRVAPELLDPILYSPEELEILNYQF